MTCSSSTPSPSPTTGWGGRRPPSTTSRSTVDEYRRSVGLVPQNVSFVPSMTCEETLEYIGWTYSMTRSAARARGRELLEAFELTAKAGQRTRALSGGQLRRLGIAAALMNRPALVFLDEPTVGLDPEVRVEVRKVIRAVSREASVVMSTHMVEDLRFIDGTVAVLAAGSLAYVGTWDDLSSRVPDVSETEGSSFELAYRDLIAEVRAS
ncbi:ABC transporter ATP-binding protein [Corynebacterium bovis]|uniref:ATP-binding cassette domain-containing protein n=1 Tax=Corynebacterium bovis TaxID=36808 RepID=UPI00254BD01D|nr:ABC transporter ATP-binding protein [Corynebacterium bovis]MDK8511126.1 ABC transporter ATP-binding protein [Corynebacterium bovis]